MRKTVIAITILAAVATAAADPLPSGPVPLGSPAHVTTEGGTDLRLPAGWILVPPESWELIDARIRAAEDDRTRLTAENESLRRSVMKGSSTWVWIVTASVIGFGAGIAYGAR